jgi:hypothetical protein
MTHLVQLCFLSSVLVCACGKVDAPPLIDSGGAGGDGGDRGDGGPEGRLELMPAAIDFGNVSIALAPPAQTLVLTNLTTAAVIPDLAFSGLDAASFRIDRSTCDVPIEPGASCAIDIGLLVDRVGAYEALIDAAAGTARASATLSALAHPADVTVVPAVDNFNDVDLATITTRQYTLSNAGEAPLPTPTLSLAGDGAYTFGTTTCTSPLAPETFCTFAVEFRPTAVGTQTAVVTATTGTLTAEVQLTGRGTSRLSVVKSGSGIGTVTGGGLACGATCASTVAATPTTLFATPAIGSRFAGWGGLVAVCGTNPTCAVPIETAAVEVLATFADLPTLTVNVVGGGSVSIDNPVTSCTGDCSFNYAAPTTVRLTGVGQPADCIGFDGFGGACAGTSVCTLTVNSNLTVFAGFSRIPGCIPQ